MLTVVEKKCYCCGEVKTLPEFGKNKSKKQGVSDECRACRAVQRKEYKQKNKLSVLKHKRTYRQKYRAEEAARKKEREVRKLKATPLWADRKEISLVYEAAAAFKLYTGLEDHVDHIVPLKGKTVCGLHCEANLQVLPASVNLSKSNKYWPDMP